MTTTIHGECPDCLYRVDRVSAVGESDRPPTHADITICFNCGAVLKFDSILDLVRPSEDEIEELPHMLRAKIEMLTDLIKRRGPLPPK